MCTMNNKGHGAKKDILAEWVLLGLKKALTVANIKSGFKATSNYPLNPHACGKHFGPFKRLLTYRFFEEAMDLDCTLGNEGNCG